MCSIRKDQIIFFEGEEGAFLYASSESEFHSHNNAVYFAKLQWNYRAQTKHRTLKNSLVARCVKQMHAKQTHVHAHRTVQFTTYLTLSKIISNLRLICMAWHLFCTLSIVMGLFKHNPEAWMFVCCECCVLSGRGLCDQLITRTEESYRMWCVVVCDLETSRIQKERRNLHNTQNATPLSNQASPMPPTRPLARGPTWPPPQIPPPWLAQILSKLAILSINILPDSATLHSHVQWRWKRQRFPKHRHFLFTRQGTTQKKKLLDIQNTAKA
jgi:hypothetical protein